MLKSSLPKLAWIACFGLAVLLVYLSRDYLTADPTDYSFVEQRETYARLQLPLLTHIAFASVALILGPVQFIGAFRRRFTSGHRLIGGVYLVSITVSGLASFFIAPSAFTGVSASAGFMVLGVLWIVSTWTAVLHAIKGHFHAHARWMIRSYALTFAAVTLRLELGALIFGAGLTQAEAYSIVAWSSWSLNLILVEWLILKRGEKGPRQISVSPVPDLSGPGRPFVR